MIPWPGKGQHAVEVAAALRDLADAPPEMHAPVQVVPRIFEPDFCRTLIRHYESRGGEVSGFMRDMEGRTTLIHDPEHKRRKDCVVDDEDLRIACMRRIRDRLVPLKLRRHSSSRPRASNVTLWLVMTLVMRGIFVPAVTTPHAQPRTGSLLYP